MAVAGDVFIKDLEMQVVTMIMNFNIEILALPLWLLASIFLDC